MRAAQPGRSDRDGDGLFDDEVNVYGTDPDVYDTDGDGIGDGGEVDAGTDPRTPGCPPDAPCPNTGSSPADRALVDAYTCEAQGLADCGGVCVDLMSDPVNCGYCGGVCASRYTCHGGLCLLAAGVFDCPPGGCIAIDVAAEDPIGGADLTLTCAAQGLTDCGGVCADLTSDVSHCGACFTVCPAATSCRRGVCASF
jgi:hypothetical protein